MKVILGLVILLASSTISSIMLMEYDKIGLSRVSSEMLLGGTIIFIATFFASFSSVRLAVKNEENTLLFLLSLILGLILSVSSIGVAVYLSAKYIEFTTLFVLLITLMSIVALFRNDSPYNRKIETLTLNDFTNGFSLLMTLSVVPAVISIIVANEFNLSRAPIEVLSGGTFIFFVLFILAFLFLWIADNNRENRRMYLFFFTTGVSLFILGVSTAFFLSYKYDQFAIYFTPFFIPFGFVFIDFVSSEIKRQNAVG